MKNRISLLPIIFLICLGLCTTTISAQSQGGQSPNAESAKMREARALYQAQNWAAATVAFEAVTKSEPNNGAAWYWLGMSYFSLSNFAKSSEALKRAAEITSNSSVMFNAACAFARLKDKDQAFNWLNKAIDAGLPQAGLIQSDTDLAVLRDDPRFKAVAEKADRLLNPCMYLPEHRQFDFWVGEWEVKATNNLAGPSIAASSIQRLENGCLIYENWMPNGAGGTGKSFNVYNRAKGKWQQTWVAAGGGVFDFIGEYKDNEMRYTGVSVGTNGQKILHRLTFYQVNKDQVRQVWESSSDEGKTWTSLFDGTYFRKPGSANN